MITRDFIKLWKITVISEAEDRFIAILKNQAINWVEAHV